MTRAKLALGLTTAAALGLAACTDPSVQTNNPNQRTTEGAVIGGVVGAITGAAIGNDSKSRNQGAVIGGIIGATAGGVIGADLDRQARDLQNSLSNSQISVVNTGSQLVVTMPQDILFATDSAVVNGQLQSDLRVLAGSINQYPNTTVQVIGHTDNTGSAAYNQSLSTQRAASVASILIGAGVSSGRIQAYGRGEDQPIASNLTPQGRAQNRRVEIVITPNG